MTSSFYTALCHLFLLPERRHHTPMDTGGHHTYFHRAPSLNMPPSARGPFFPQTHVCSLPSSVARRQRNAQSVPAGKHAVAYVVAVGAMQLQPHTGSLPSIRGTRQENSDSATPMRASPAGSRPLPHYVPHACVICVPQIRLFF